MTMGPRNVLSEELDLAEGACGHVGGCGCPDGVFYGTEEHSDADPGL